MNKTTLIVIVGLVVLVGGYFLLRGGYQTPTQTGTETPSLKVPAPGFESVPETQVAPDGERVTKEITVVGTDFAFSTSTITVKAGESIALNFKNDGKVIHNWTLERQGIGTQTIGGGTSDAVEFTAPPAGSYTYFCSVPGHRERGMVGTLTVE